jgi:hypothetical protein
MAHLSSSSLFHQRTGVLATMHQKEQVIAPMLESHLGIEIVVPQGFNTDQFGTFTRDVNRPGTQLETARLKAEAAMTLTGLTLAIASEGSFGSHPSIPFLACDREIVMLCDRDHDLEIVGQAISTETNFSHQQVTSVEEAIAFAQKISFPSHGLVAMPEAQWSQPSHIFKGIIDETQLRETVTQLLQKFGHAHLETDMRAMYNPTRMAVIAEATRDLIQRLNQCCPQCGCPGFAPVEHKAGLPCSLCGFPTGLTLAIVHRCQKCHFSSMVQFPDGKEFADPGQCSYCNP